MIDPKHALRHGDAKAQVIGRRAFLHFAVSGAAVLAAPLFCGNGLAWGARRQAPLSDASASPAGAVCPDGDPASFTPVTAQRGGMFLLFSDVHFDPFADPAKVSVLAAAPASAWRGILSDAAVCSPYGQDSNDALFQSFLDDMARRAPRPDFLLFPGDLLCHDFWTTYPRLTGDVTPEGLLAFIAKTAEYVLTEVTRRFPDAPLYLALGNNDSFEGDYRIAPKSPYLSATAPLVARLALKDPAARVPFLDSYPHDGCYTVPLPGPGGGRLMVLNNIFWTKRSGREAAGRRVLEFLDNELRQAERRGEKVWLMAHVPPGDNSKASAAKYVKKGKDVFDPMLTEAWNDAQAGLIVKYAATIKASFAGHVHRDEFRLMRPRNGDLPVAAMRLGPSISPVTGNNPGYQVYSYDRETLELLDMTTHYLDIAAASPAWATEYQYSQTYGRGLRSATDWQEMYQGLVACPTRGQAFAQGFDLRSAHIDEVNGRTFRIFWDALSLSVDTL
ncbi:metallophosphoesterase [Desulfolutivibrio sp.]|uniref:metallophosphoesterase n=1 Tax=Desulfolutivibrio sp. TaxID=2773296 RepID=UPI002F968C14